MSTPSKAGFHYEISEAQLTNYQKWTIEEKFAWLEQQASFLRSIQTREERIRCYRAKGGKNIKYYDENGWPEWL